MQNLINLLTDLGTLRQEQIHPHQVAVKISRNRWSPVVCVTIDQFETPVGIQPRRANLAVPISDTYGFCESFLGHWVMCDEPLTLGTMRVPFCLHRRGLEYDVLVDQFAYFRQCAHDEAYGICIVQSSEKDSPSPGLVNLMAAFREWLDNPIELVTQELQTRQKEWEEHPCAWSLSRLGHLFEGLFCFDAAMDVYSQGRTRYKGKRMMFETLLTRCRRRSELWEHGKL